MKTINTRRSIRKYSDKEVSEELLSRLLTEAARTQTMGNMQLYSVVVTRSDTEHVNNHLRHIYGCAKIAQAEPFFLGKVTEGLCVEQCV